VSLYVCILMYDERRAGAVGVVAGCLSMPKPPRVGGEDAGARFDRYTTVGRTAYSLWPHWRAGGERFP